MATIIQLRRDTAANWTSADPTLAEGEEGYETDTGKRKVGDGVTAWTSLAYAASGVTDGDKGDITVTASGATWTIDNSAVTLAKIQDIADQTMLGNNTGGAAAPVELTASDVKTLLALTSSDVGLGSVTNDAQTKAAIVPNTAPSSGQVLIGNASGTAYAAKSLSGGATVDDTGAVTLSVSNPDVTTAIATDPAAVRDALGENIKNRWEIFTDFSSQAAASSFVGPEWFYSGSGSGHGLVDPGLGGNWCGAATLSMGTTSTGRAAVLTGAAAVLLGNGKAYFRSHLQLASLSDTTDTYIARIGFIDSATANPPDGVFFRYTDGTNSGKWEAVCRQSNTETAMDTGITAVAGTDRVFEITVNAAGTSAEFKIDGSVVQTITTNIPTSSGRTTGVGASCVRSASGGGTKLGLSLDYLYARIDLTTAR